MPDVPQQPYKQILKDNLILREYLAMDRTVLANERTLLAYIKMTLASLITAIGFEVFPG